MPSMGGVGGVERTTSTMRVMGEARGSAPGGADYSVWLLQADGAACIAVDGSGPQLEIRSALTGELLADQALVAKARTAIALHHAGDVAVTSEQDEDGVWCAQAILAPGIAVYGDGETQQDAIDDCNGALDLLLDELRGVA